MIGLMPQIQVPPSGMISRRTAGTYLGLTPETLAGWERQGRGPRVVRLCGKAFYSFAELEAFARGEEPSHDAA